MRLTRKSGRSLAVAIGAAFTLAIWGAPAQAHEMIAYQGSDWARLSADHFSITVVDAECDNNGVYAGFVTRGGNFYTVGDPNGCSPNGGYLYSPDGTQVESFYVCERNVACSATKFVS